MKKINFFIGAMTLLMAFVACDPVGPTSVDERDKFVGTYAYEATGKVDFAVGSYQINVPLDETGTFTIAKVGNKDSVVIEGYHEPIGATISGDQLKLAATTYDTTYGSIALKLSFTEGTATLDGNKLSWNTDVNGIGQYSGIAAKGTGTVSVVATKQ